MKKINLSGVFTALVTIFDQNNRISYDQISNLVDFQISSGIDGILICGSTGEASTISEMERLELIQFLIRKINKRVPTMIGVNFNSTDYAVEQAKLYESYDIDCLLVNNPSYNKPSEEGIFQHFKAIANAVSNLPIIIYNIPSRSIFNLSDSLLIRIFEEIPNVIGMKDSTGSIDRHYFLQRKSGKFLSMFCGDDNLGPFYSINGGCGVISVLSNLFPKEIVNLYKLLKEEKYKEAFQIHKSFMELYRVMFIETNPVPIKYALKIDRGYSDKVRLPLLELSEDSKKIIEVILRNYESKIKL
jgi:4-hydroxy-tetrahydrodipicolinate synthase